MKIPEASLIIGELKATQGILKKLQETFSLYESNFSNPGRRDLRDAVLLSDILTKTYTCLETVFLRISRAFENQLPPAGWHKELLRKMRLDIPEVRPPVLSEASFVWLDELRRFRHFHRYYYDIELDWTRLEILAQKFRENLARIDVELDNYADFCQSMIEQETSNPGS